MRARPCVARAFPTPAFLVFRAQALLQPRRASQCSHLILHLGITTPQQRKTGLPRQRGPGLGQGRAGQGRREAGGQEEQGHIHRWAAEMLPHKRLKRADGVRKLQQRPGQGSSATRDIGFSGQASLRRTNRRVTWTNSCHATRQGGGQSPVGWTWGRRKCGHVSGILSPGPKTAGGGQTTRHVCLHSPRRKEWLRDHTPPPDTSSRAPSPLLALWLRQGTGAHPMPNAAAGAKPRGAVATLQHPGHHRQSAGTCVLGGPGCNPRGRQRIRVLWSQLKGLRTPQPCPERIQPPPCLVQLPKGREHSDQVTEDPTPVASGGQAQDPPQQSRAQPDPTPGSA